MQGIFWPDRPSELGLQSRLLAQLVGRDSVNWNFLLLLAVGRDHFLESILEQLPAVFECLAFSDYFRPFDQLAHGCKEFSPAVGPCEPG
jgi:hypothetical protein